MSQVLTSNGGESWPNYLTQFNRAATIIYDLPKVRKGCVIEFLPKCPYQIENPNTPQEFELSFFKMNTTTKNDVTL